MHSPQKILLNSSIIVYPTSADPPTYGHADLINRVYDKFEKIYWVTADSIQKKNYFPIDLRLKMMQEYQKYYNWKNVVLDNVSSSIASYAVKKKAGFLLRGIRNHGDFSFEFELATGNRVIAPLLETLFILAKPEFCTISSSIARELLFLNENTKSYLLPSVAKKAQEYLKNK